MKLKIKILLIAVFSVLIVTGCKKDKDNQPIAPTVVSADPANNANNVARNKVITVTFSENMDPSTFSTSTFKLMLGTNAVLGQVQFAGKTATFTPANNMAVTTVYTATITTGVKNANGIALANNYSWKFTTGGSSLLAAINLGTSANYVILAKTAINNNPTSVITGDMGISPAATSYITGFSLTNATGYATSSQVTGNIYAADMVAPTPINLTTAVNNMVTAYNDAAGRPSPDFFELGAGNIGGKTLQSGLYKWTNTVIVPTDVTLSGNASDVWIFQVAGGLILSSGVKILLSGGAQAQNIFWQVAGGATIGTSAHVEGVILSQTGITFGTGASMNGRALAQTAVILDGNTIKE